MVDPTYTCLIPYTRKDTLEVAVASAEADGWNVETLQDVRWAGVNKIREALLCSAFVDEKIKFIRYLDDDDILLPHLDRVKEIFETNPEIDLIHTNAIAITPSGIVHNLTYSENPVENTLRVHPWSWIARASALKEIKRVYGYLWDYDRPYREGGFVWLKFLQMGLKMHYLKVDGYQYNKSFNPQCISQQPGFVDATKDLIKILR